MSSSSAASTPTSPTSGSTSITSSTGKPFSMSVESFSLDLSSAHVTPSSNGSIKSPPLKSPTAARRVSSFTRESMLSSSDKPRGLSQSSQDRESVASNLRQVRQPSEETTNSSNPLKRRSTDTGVDYPRRRATIACEICRSRKSRCDGNKPKCRLCIELGAECIYREPGIKLDAGDKLILEHLTRIEGLLQSNLINQTNNLAISSGSPAVSNGTAISNDDLMAQASVNFVSMIPVTGLGTWTSPTNISTMPKVHTNAALHLLQWPVIRELVSRPYDPQILLQLEMSREPISVSRAPPMDLSNTAAYTQAFFERVNPWYACVNPFNWKQYYQAALSSGFRDGPESCVVLLVLALGQASLRGSISRIGINEDPPGLAYFAAAWVILPGLVTRNSVLAAQSMILASAYLFYLVRPLEAWTLLSGAGTKLQLLLSAPGRIPVDQRELCERVYWNALLFESDLLAEMDLPHSGIVQFEESVGLPGGFHPTDDEPAGRDDIWYFLAEIALRRLLNRVSQLIYSKDSMASTQSLEPVVAELEFQLTQWYDGLPLSLQFSYSREPLSNPIQTVLRLRYFACRTIIFRPYILAVLDNEQAILDPAVRENCRKCLEASIRQLEHITAHHAGHMPYLWQGALSIVSQTLLVMGATMCMSLAPLLPPPETMDSIFHDVVAEVERYSLLAPSLQLSAEIVREAEQRRQMFLRNSGLR